MKKTLSVFLTLAMMLTMLSLPLTSVSAAESASPSSEIYDTTKAENGVLTLEDGDYTVITTADGLRGMTGEGKYILGADIDFEGAAWGSAINWYGALEGNGHTVKGFSVEEGGMFSWNAQGKDTLYPVKITNVTFGESVDHPICVSYGANSLQGLFSRQAISKDILVENVTAYVEVGSGAKNNYYIGGFIGEFAKTDASKITFRNCVIDGSINGTVFLGGYIGLFGTKTPEASVTFENCVNSVDIVKGGENQYRLRGGFIGAMNVNCGTVNVTNCINEGNIIGGGKYIANIADSASVGAIVGDNADGRPLNVNGFLNLGEITMTDYPEQTGAVVGLQKDGVEVNATNVVTVTKVGNSVGNPTKVTADDLASGKAAYLLGEGFGQEIGVETMPKIGGMPVTERVIGENTYYGNVIECEDNKATVYAQFTDDNNGLRSHRVLVAVPAAYLAEVTSVEFCVTYTLDASKTQNYNGATEVVAKLAGEDVSSYCVVKAANGTYATKEGVVLLAVVITDVPTADWTEMNVTLKVTGSDAAVAAYTANDTFVKANIF